MAEEVESITEESIKAAEIGYKELISKKEELSKLTEELTKKIAQIDHITQSIQNRLLNPMKPSTLDIHS